MFASRMHGLGMFLVGVFVLFCTANVSLCQAQAISIGVPPFPRELNFLVSDHPLARFVRGGTLEVLLSVSPDHTNFPYRLALSDSFNVSDDRRIWNFRLRPSARFLNGLMVDASDATYSLRRCASAGTIKGVVEIHPVLREPIPGEVERSVEVTLERGVDGKLTDLHSAGAEFLRQISQCPILEQRSSTVFGRDLGVGTNVVSSGRYKIADLNLGKDLTLVRVRGERIDEVGQFGFRAIEDVRHGITALRTGTLDALYVRVDEGLSQEILDKIRKDETLKSIDCGTETIIHRRGLQVDCSASSDLSGIKYVT